MKESFDCEYNIDVFDVKNKRQSRRCEATGKGCYFEFQLNPYEYTRWLYKDPTFYKDHPEPCLRLHTDFWGFGGPV